MSPRRWLVFGTHGAPPHACSFMLQVHHWLSEPSLRADLGKGRALLLALLLWGLFEEPGVERHELGEQGNREASALGKAMPAAVLGGF